jgi:dTDP-4-amino-4,6-dideoxygalactose transaminase
VHAIESPFRDEIHRSLGSQQIQTAIHYPVPIHLMEAYLDPAFPSGSFPHAESAAGRVLSLPVYPELSQAAVEQIAEAVRASLATAA